MTGEYALAICRPERNTFCGAKDLNRRVTSIKVGVEILRLSLSDSLRMTISSKNW
jgi:hypothetical protein